MVTREIFSQDTAVATSLSESSPGVTPSSSNKDTQATVLKKEDGKLMAAPDAQKKEDPQVISPTTSPKNNRGKDSGVKQKSEAFEEKEGPSPVELNGDQVEFVLQKNMLVATGNVSMVKDETKLTCDKLEFSRDTQIATAEGNVILTTKEGTILGHKMKYNFLTMQGEFIEPKFASAPLYGAGKELIRVDTNHMIMKDGYMTTCDLDHPHFRIKSKVMDVYPQKKLVARHVRMFIGPVPVAYLHSYTQLLNEKPRVVYTPGYDKEWGAFLLQSWRYRLHENVKGTVHLDYREKKDFASGVDVKYKTPAYGNGIIRTYYMHERNLKAKHFWQERPRPTVERERFKAEWRHQWDIDERTQATSQFYRLSDENFLKEYFKREYEKDSNASTYFLLTHGLRGGNLSFLADARVNRFTAAIEKLPEVRYNLSSQEIGNTNLFLKSANTYSNFTKKEAAPSEVRKKSMRMDSDNEVSYPFKLAFIELRPFVGGRHTYYNRTPDRTRYDSIRGIFRTGSDLSTKFYKIYDYYSDFAGVSVNRLRHVITPSIAYLYTHDPTIPSSYLEQFDGIDSATRGHSIGFALDNTFQTKRAKKSVDLLRMILSTDFRLKEDIAKGGFNSVRSDIELKPMDWLAFYFDSDYDIKQERLSSANFDLYLNGGDKWSFDLGKRYQVEADDQITTEIKYRINSKWKVRTYQRVDIGKGTIKEQEYSFIRDLHEWEMDMHFNETRGEGSEIWLVFSLKAFPDSGIEAGTSFNRRKLGSQSF